MELLRYSEGKKKRSTVMFLSSQHSTVNLITSPHKTKEMVQQTPELSPSPTFKQKYRICRIYVAPVAPPNQFVSN